MQDRETEAAAESLLIAFKGRRNTTFIGKRTGGFVHNGTYWDLTDGAILWIAEEYVFDRNGLSYPEGLEPDFELEDPPWGTRIDLDPAVIKAERWLSGAN